MSSSPVLSLRGATKAFGGATVLKSIDLDIQQGEFVSLLGPSGCGKTTTLNIIAGFTAPDSGDVIINGQRVNDVPPHQRDLGMVFQGHALFPHMTCFDNVAFGLRMRKLAPEMIRERVLQALDLVRLADFSQRYPRELSGGQQQRVGLARALAINPRVLLLDEPLSNLDAKLRRAMQSELRSIHTQLRTTMVYVTHDQEEALTLSDRIALMRDGRIEQIDTPEGIYCRPQTRFVADFIGSSSFLRGVVAEVTGQGARVRVGDAGNVLVAHDAPLAVGREVLLGVRADRIRPAAASPDTLRGRVADRIFAGASTHLRIDLGQGDEIVAHLAEPPAPELVTDAPVAIAVAPRDWIVLP
ncbi:ABC transporter ATP-binding protein [Ferrovibrio sp.]|uniref:ABC transporter ATP-binding protein n=1 Tax=Ferrovibrio sp. TaxID=1917215 RepID=UPI003D13F03E